MEIKLSVENNFDSKYTEHLVTVFYNKNDLPNSLGYFPEKLCIIDFFDLIDNGQVALYSETEKKFVPEIKKEIFDTDFERRIRYYFPDGTRFVDAKTMCKTP